VGSNKILNNPQDTGVIMEILIAIAALVFTFFWALFGNDQK